MFLFKLLVKTHRKLLSDSGLQIGHSNIAQENANLSFETSDFKAYSEEDRYQNIAPGNS